MWAKLMAWKKKRLLVRRTLCGQNEMQKCGSGKAFINRSKANPKSSLCYGNKIEIPSPNLSRVKSVRARAHTRAHARIHTYACAHREFLLLCSFYTYEHIHYLMYTIYSNGQEELEDSLETQDMVSKLAQATSPMHETLSSSYLYQLDKVIYLFI